jgi:hypothetical protein
MPIVYQTRFAPSISFTGKIYRQRESAPLQAKNQFWEIALRISRRFPAAFLFFIFCFFCFLLFFVLGFFIFSKPNAPCCYHSKQLQSEIQISNPCITPKMAAG